MNIWKNNGLCKATECKKVSTHLCWLWRWRKRTSSQGMRQPLAAEKGKEMASLLEPPEGMHSNWHLAFHLVRPILDFWPSSLLPLSLSHLLSSSHSSIHESSNRPHWSWPEDLEHSFCDSYMDGSFWSFYHQLKWCRLRKAFLASSYNCSPFSPAPTTKAGFAVFIWVLPVFPTRRKVHGSREPIYLVYHWIPNTWASPWHTVGAQEIK